MKVFYKVVFFLFLFHMGSGTFWELHPFLFIFIFNEYACMSVEKLSHMQETTNWKRG